MKATINSSTKTKLSSFVQNLGQQDQRVHFMANNQLQSFFFLADRIVLTEKESPGTQCTPNHEAEKCFQKSVALELSFVNANSALAPNGLDPCQGAMHFFLGKDSSKWVKNVPHYERLKYVNIWQGVDLELCNSDDGIKFNWMLETPSHLSSLHIAWNGADLVEISSEGNLLVHHALGILTDQKPIAWQNIGGEQSYVDCSYCLIDKAQVGFKLTGDYQADLPLIIDPALPFTTYLGGDGFDEGHAIAIDDLGDAYVTGRTDSSDFPTTLGAFITAAPASGQSAFVSKISADGTSLIYSTYYGGDTGSTVGMAICVNSAGEVYATGYTQAQDLPMAPNAFQPAYGPGFNNGFVMQLSADGSDLLSSTYLGTGGSIYPRDITLDGDQNVYVTGFASATLPTTPGVFQPTFSSATPDGFICKFDEQLSTVELCTYLGGTATDMLMGIVVDDAGFIYVAGNSYSGDFPTTIGSYQPSKNGMSDNAIITKFNSALSALVFSTFLGGTQSGGASGLAVDASGAVCVAGMTTATDFPVTPGAYQSSNLGYQTGFISKLSADGSSLLFSTYLGGVESVIIDDLAMDASGCVYVTGVGTYPDYPVTPSNPPIPSPTSGAILTCLSPELSTLVYSTVIGNTDGGGRGYGIAIDPERTAYVTGGATMGMPTTPGVLQPAFGGGGSDAFVAKVPFQVALQINNATLLIKRIQ